MNWLAYQRIFKAIETTVWNRHSPGNVGLLRKGLSKFSWWTALQIKSICWDTPISQDTVVVPSVIGIDVLISYHITQSQSNLTIACRNSTTRRQWRITTKLSNVSQLTRLNRRLYSQRTRTITRSTGSRSVSSLRGRGLVRYLKHWSKMIMFGIGFCGEQRSREDHENEACNLNGDGFRIPCTED